MQKKLNIFQVLTLLAYIWVIATLPLHSHPTSEDNHEHCSHKHDQEHSHEANQQEDCVICLNLHTPSAINNIQFFETSIVAIDYYPSYHTDRAIIGYDHYISHTSNKDPPLSIIS